MSRDGPNDVKTQRDMTRVHPAGSRSAIGNLLCVLVIAVAVSGCSLVGGSATDHVDNPLADRQSRAQVIDPLTSMVQSMRLTAVLATFAWESCNDQNDIPFRGRANANVATPANTTPTALRQQIRDTLITTQGWHDGPPDGKTLYGLSLHKGAVMAALTINGNQTTIPDTVSVDIFGECRNTTNHAGAPIEPIIDQFGH